MKMEVMNVPEKYWTDGVNPIALAVWKEEDRLKKVMALDDLVKALFKAQELYEVEDQSGHPLDKAYELIFDFIEKEGFNHEIF